MSVSLLQLQKAAYAPAYEERRKTGTVTRETIETLIDRWLAAPLVAYAAEFQTVIDAKALIADAVQEAVAELLDLLKVERRRALLLEARLVALGEL